MDISFFLLNVYEAATVSQLSISDSPGILADLQRVCTAVKEEFSPKEYLPYLPDTNFVMCSYAVSGFQTGHGDNTDHVASFAPEAFEAGTSAIS